LRRLREEIPDGWQRPLSGATATGATMIEAEKNLSIRIDELV
jgi:hypothetical protein